MIRIIGETKKRIMVRASYIPEVFSFDIEFDIMNDDNIIAACRVTNSSMVWVVEDNIIGEIELYSPEIIKTELFSKINDVATIEALPLVEIDADESKSADVELGQEKFIIWLDRKEKIDKKYIYQDLVFYASNDQIVAIEANNYKTIIYEK